MVAVSIVMANFNRSDFLGLAIDSVVQQTHSDWELVIIDDGSSDDSLLIARGYESRDSRIRVHAQSNAGQAAARNVGIRGTSASLVCFIDSDDLWTPEKLECQLRLMTDDSSTDVLYGEENLIDQEGNPVSESKMRRYSGLVWRELLSDNFVTFSTVMVRRSVLEKVGGFDPDIRYADDYDLWLRLSVFARFRYCPSLWGYYRVGAQQISSDKANRFASNQRILEQFFDRNPTLASPDVVRSAWCRFHARWARTLANAGRSGAAFQAASKSLYWDPRQAHGWRAMARAAFSFLH